MNYPAFLVIANGTYQEAHIEITLYNGGNPVEIRETVSPGELYKHDFGDATTIKQIENPRDSAGRVVKYGTHIRSDVKVTAYYMMNAEGSRDIFTLKGRQGLGLEFYVPMQSDNQASAITGGSRNWLGLDQVDIVATEDNTLLTVVPAGDVRLAKESQQLSPAGNTIQRTLNRGESLKILEYDQDEFPTLAGTSITATKPIAVTVTEDMVGGDTSGDQIVPVNSLGTRYIVPRTYLENRRIPQLVERFYLVAAENDTEVKIYATAGSDTPDALIVLPYAGQVARYDLPVTAIPTLTSVYVESDKPVYLYQRGGSGEEGAALLPSIYGIGQTRLSFYQISSPVQKGFLIFRNGAENGFTIKYGSEEVSSLPLVPLDIPNVPDWKVARFDYQTAPAPTPDNPQGGQVITVGSEESAFSLGYITGDVPNNNSYGYFSAFGTFELPAITYLCGSSVTLQGGYAKSFLWTFPGGATATTSSITATQEGLYTLEMDQDGNTVIASTTVRKINAGSIASAGETICTGETPAPLSVAGALYPSTGMALAFQWQYSYDNATWVNIPGATSSTYAPGPLTRTTWFRWKISADLCEDETEAVQVKVSSCTLPVNPHLMIRYE